MRVLDLTEEIRMLNPRKNGSAVTKKKEIMVNTINIIIQCQQAGKPPQVYGKNGCAHTDVDETCASVEFVGGNVN